MAAKADKKASNPLPVNADDLKPSSNITYNNEVVAIIAGLAANEVEGIAGMCNVSSSLMNKNRSVTRGVKVEVGSEEVAVDLYVIVEYGIPIQRAAADAQENVRKAIESMTGLHVVRVDVHVQSVSFEQDKKALQAGVQNAALAAGQIDPEPEEKAEKKPENGKKAEPEKETAPAKAAAPGKAKEPVKAAEPEKEDAARKAAAEKQAPKPKAEKPKAEPAAKAKKAPGKTEPENKETKPEEKQGEGKKAPEA